jgi:hypothetical protein
MSCWAKAHEFYIPKGLFKDNVDGKMENDKLLCISVGSDLNKRKKEALGIAFKQRGRTKTKKRQQRSPPRNLVINEDSNKTPTAMIAKMRGIMLRLLVHRVFECIYTFLFTFYWLTIDVFVILFLMPFLLYVVVACKRGGSGFYHPEIFDSRVD